MQITVGIVVVTKSQAFFDAGVTVLNDIKDYVFHSVDIDTQLKVSIRPPMLSPLYEETRTKAIDFLRGRKETINIEVIQATDIKEATIKVMEKDRARASSSDESSTVFQMGMLYYDQSSLYEEDDSIEKIDRDLLQFYRTLDESHIATYFSLFQPLPLLDSCVKKSVIFPSNRLKSYSRRI